MHAVRADFKFRQEHPSDNKGHLSEIPAAVLGVRGFALHPLVGLSNASATENTRERQDEACG